MNVAIMKFNSLIVINILYYFFWDFFKSLRIGLTSNKLKLKFLKQLSHKAFNKVVRISLWSYSFGNWFKGNYLLKNTTLLKPNDLYFKID